MTAQQARSGGAREAVARQPRRGGADQDPAAVVLAGGNVIRDVHAGQAARPRPGKDSGQGGRMDAESVGGTFHGGLPRWIAVERPGGKHLQPAQLGYPEQQVRGQQHAQPAQVSGIRACLHVGVHPQRAGTGNADHGMRAGPVVQHTEHPPSLLRGRSVIPRLAGRGEEEPVT